MYNIAIEGTRSTFINAFAVVSDESSLAFIAKHISAKIVQFSNGDFCFFLR